MAVLSYLALLLFLVFAPQSCVGHFAPSAASVTPFVLGTQVTPPERWRAIWAEAERCTGLTGDFDRIDWHEKPGNSFPTEDGAANGRWTRPHSITLAHDWLTTDWVIKHEMIHDLRQAGHWEWQRHLYWGMQCHATWGYQPIDSNYRP